MAPKRYENTSTQADFVFLLCTHGKAELKKKTKSIQPVFFADSSPHLAELASAEKCDGSRSSLRKEIL